MNPLRRLEQKVLQAGQEYTRQLLEVQLQKQIDEPGTPSPGGGDGDGVRIVRENRTHGDPVRHPHQ